LRAGCVRAAKRACTFEPSEGVIKFSEPVQKIGRLLGAQEFQAIYNAPVPSELVDYVISPENEETLAAGYCRPALGEVTVEVLRGRLAWQDRFGEAGVPDPQTYTAPSYLHRDGKPIRETY
jgi:hypothetical protein